MRNPLRKRFKREVIGNAGRYFAIFVIFVVTVLIISGFLVTADGTKLAYEKDQIRSKVEDGQFASMVSINKEDIEEIEKLGIDVIENEYIDVKFFSTQTIRVYKNRTNFNLATVWEGSLPQKKDEIAIERTFGNKHNLVIGDSISIGGTHFTISGIVSLSDYSSLFLSNTDILMDSYEFGLALTTASGFESLSKTDIIHNYSFRYNNRELTNIEKNNLCDDIKERMLELNIPLTNFLMSKDNQAISFYYDDVGSDVPMMKSFLYIMLVIMAFVFTVIISSTTEEESSVIGTLMASGYTKGELILHYLELPIYITLFGVIVGNVLSYTLGVQLFKSMYYTNYSLPPNNHTV